MISRPRLESLHWETWSVSEKTNAQIELVPINDYRLWIKLTFYPNPKVVAKMSILNWVRRGVVPWEIKPQIRRRFPTPQKLKTPKKLRLQQCVMLRWRMLLPPEKGNVVSTGHTLQRLGPIWPVMPVFHSTHKKSTFQPKNRPRIGEGVKTSLHTWCIYYIDRVYISRFSKFRGLWQKSKEDIFLVNNGCVHNSSNGTNIDFAIGCLW